MVMVLKQKSHKREAGVTIIVVALSMVAMLVMAAMVIDLGNARQVARRSQGSVDAAALAGAKDLPLSASNAADPTFENAARATAMGYVVRNVFQTSPPTPPTCAPGVDTCTATVNGLTITVTTPYSGISGTPPYNLIYVKACETTEQFLSRVVTGSGTRVCREAVARRKNSSGGYGFGLVALEPTECNALQFRGDSDTILSSNGAVMVNSSCTNTSNGALDSSGSRWDLIANFIGVVGTATLNPCEPPVDTSCTTTIPTEGISPFDDPLASLPEPTDTTPVRSCTGDTSVAGVEFFQPGYFSAACNFNSNKTYVFAPGVYTFANGFSSGGNASMMCRNTATASTCDAGIGGVTFFLKGGTTTMNGTGAVNLPAPRSGTYKGVTIFQARSNTNTLKINGTNDFELGTIYAPSANMEFSGSAGSNEVNVTGMVIGRKVDIGGTFAFNINVPLDGPSAPTDDDIGLEK
jgi:Flp pilus assembly protein TadG